MRVDFCYQPLLNLVCAGLKNKLWSEVEPVAYYKAVRGLFSSLLPLLERHENKVPQVQSVTHTTFTQHFAVYNRNCSSGDRKIARWLYLVYHVQYEYLF